MAKYLMLGKYSVEGMKGISKKRTDKALKIIKKAGGKVNAMYVLLGCYDVALLVEFPGDAASIRASIGLTRLTGIGFTTFPAVSVPEFDRIAG